MNKVIDVDDNDNINSAEAEVDGLEVHGIKRGRKHIKTKVEFNVSLNEEQKEIKSKILRDTISVLTGKAGSGKTLLATQIALEYLYYKEVDKIIITRPTVSDEEIGFLPGDIKEKLSLIHISEPTRPY